MRNDGLEKALEKTWGNKEKFYEDTKGLSMLEIVKQVESRHRPQGAVHVKIPVQTGSLVNR